MRAVELSIGAFCTEFPFEQLCDDDCFLDRGQLWYFREKGRPESCRALDRCILHRISVRTTLWQWHFLGSRSTFGPWDIHMEIVTKVVPMRAVELSSGAFCIEFLCEQLCDIGSFGMGAGRSTIGAKLGLKKWYFLTRGSQCCFRELETAGSGRKKKNLNWVSKCIQL